MTYIGIDPGKKGGLALIGKTVEVYPFDKTVYRNVLANLKDCVCIIEKVGAMPHQGVTSMFHFGENFGWIQGVVEANNIPYELVTPQKWKKEFSVTADKNTAILVCERLFPKVNLVPKGCRKPNDGCAEALLLAEFARRHCG